MNIDGLSYNSALLSGKGIPEFNKITPHEVEEKIPLLLKELNNKVALLEENLQIKIQEGKLLSWEAVINPLYEIEEKLKWSWGLVCHLNAVCNSDELRKAHSNQQPEVIRFSNKIGQSKIFYQAISLLKENANKELNNCQKRIVEAEILAMKQKGVGLSESVKDEFNANSERLAELSTKFSNNVLDATKEWKLLLNNKEEVEGLPLRTLESLAAFAKEAGKINLKDNTPPTSENGPWLIGLDLPSYISFMTYGSNRLIREKLYRAYVKRASLNKLNNEPLIEEILTLREKQSKLLGYRHWADLSLASKMANDVEEVENLLEELRSAALPAANKEIEELESLARETLSEDITLEPWDISFWSEKLKLNRYNLNQEHLRPWFPLPQVLNGLFSLCERLFNIYIEEANGQVPVWHKDVLFFKVKDNKGQEIAAFFLDPYSRPSNKRGGAWMDECLVRNNISEGEIVLPVAYLICNQTPPLEDKPSLMSFEEVETLFHEFGHGLQHMLTTVNYPNAAGINNIEWDAVELASQFMENWCLERSTLMSLAKHWETGEKLPEQEYKKLCLSRTFNSGLSTLRQVHFALTDIKLHSTWGSESNQTPDELRREIAKSTTVIKPIAEDRFLCSFSHIFAGGYSAGYYSYKWAEVLSSDAFEAFEEAGNNEERIRETGMKFRETILSLGGSFSPKEIYKSFRGREAKTDALIRHSGLRKN